MKNETRKTLDSTKSFAKEYLTDMTPARLGAELTADRDRLRLLYDEAIGEEGQNLNAPSKVLSLFSALTRRLNPTRRLVFGLSTLGMILMPFSFTPSFIPPLSFIAMFFVLMLELLEKSDVKQEIDLARQIQISLLPDSHLNSGHIETYSFANTAKVVGGDYIDLIETDSGVYLFIADVAGKGLSAALYMVRLQALVKMTIEKTHPTPKQLFMELNNYIKSDKKDKTFVTAVAAFFPNNAEHFFYARAGHNHPLMYHAANDNVSELDAKGFALGMTSNKQMMNFLEEVRVDFKAGDQILFYTDGLTEARSKDGREFGDENLKTLLEVYGSLPAKNVVKKIQSSLGVFIGNQSLMDDVTFTCVRYKDIPLLNSPSENNPTTQS